MRGLYPSCLRRTRAVTSRFISQRRKEDDRKIKKEGEEERGGERRGESKAKEQVRGKRRIKTEG